MSRKTRQAMYYALKAKEMLKKSKNLIADADDKLEDIADDWTKEDNKTVDAPSSIDINEDQNTKISKEKKMNKYKKEAHRHLVKARKLLAMGEDMDMDYESGEEEMDYDEEDEMEAGMYAMDEDEMDYEAMDDDMDYEAMEDDEMEEEDEMEAGMYARRRKSHKRKKRAVSLMDVISEVEDDIEDNFDGVLEEADTGVGEGGDGENPVLNVAKLKEASKRLDRLASHCEKKKSKKAKVLAFSLDKIADMVDKKIKRASK